MELDPPHIGWAAFTTGQPTPCRKYWLDPVVPAGIVTVIDWLPTDCPVASEESNSLVGSGDVRVTVRALGAGWLRLTTQATSR